LSAPASRKRACTPTTAPSSAVGANAGDPHYEPLENQSATITAGSLVLLDMWAKLDRPGSIYYDITWTGYCGAAPPEDIQRVFQIVSSARDAGIECVPGRYKPAANRFTVLKSMTPRGRLSPTRDLAISSFTEQDIRSALRYTETAPIWIILRRTMTVGYSVVMLLDRTRRLSG